MPNTIMDLREKRAKVWDAAKQFLDSKRGENGLLSAEATAQYEKMEADVVAFGKEIERLERQAAMDAELAKLTNAAIVGKPSQKLGAVNASFDVEDEKEGRASSAYKGAFWNAMRGLAASANISPREVYNVLSIGVQSDGGFTVPDEFERQLIDALHDENIVRSLATVIQTDSGSRSIPVIASHGVADWVDENAAVPESDDQFGVVQLSAYKLATTLKISDELLSDSAFNLETYIAKEFARRIGRAEEQAFLVGNGTSKPTGIFTSAPVGVTTAANNAITLDEILDLYHSLREPYRRNAAFLMHDTTIKSLRKLKDATGQYIWQPSIKEGTPDLLINRPIRTSSYVPTVAAGAKCIAFGDYSYYWIADRQGRVFKRLNERYAEKMQVGFLASQRVDGKLILPEAVRTLSLKA